MLTKFSVANFRNFKEKILVDLTKSKIVLFGKNGEGKSNIGHAIFDIVRTITDLYIGIYNSKNFINADSDSEYVEFNYEFKFGKDNVKYKYIKNMSGILMVEELIINNELIYKFDFKKRKGKFNLTKVGAETLNIDKENIKIAILKFIVNNTIQKEDSIIIKIVEFVKHMIFFNSINEKEFIGFEIQAEDIEQWIIRNNLVHDFENFLRRIAKVNIHLTSKQIGDKEFLVEKHKKMSLIFKEVISSGIKPLEIFYYWRKRFEKTSLVFIDGFDAFYNYEVSKNVIELLFQYENMQTIITTNNISLRNNKLIKEDWYYTINDRKIVSHN